MIKKKKAVSPLIATVLLILIVIILAIIILIWARGFIKEALTKDVAGTTKKVDQFCPEVSIETAIGDSSITIKNKGNIPIYAFDAQLTLKGAGSSTSTRIDGPLNPGTSISFNINYNDYEQVKLIPILLGKSKSGGTQEYECSSSDGIAV